MSDSGEYERGKRDAAELMHAELYAWKARFEKREKEIERLLAALKPFAAAARGIPDNWPGQCRLRIDCDERCTREWFSYHGVHDCPDAALPTINEWREAARAAEGGE